MSMHSLWLWTAFKIVDHSNTSNENAKHSFMFYCCSNQ